MITDSVIYFCDMKNENKMKVLQAGLLPHDQFLTLFSVSASLWTL